MSFILTVFLFISQSVSVLGYTIYSLPNTKQINNSNVCNPDEILSYQTVVELNSLITSIEQQKGAEVAVVIVNEIDNQHTPKSFATSLFNHWGIGKTESDNGLLILLVKAERRIEFETGYGLEGVLPDITCFRIQQDVMLPHFRNGDYDRGLLAGVRVVSNRLIQSDLTIPTPRKSSGIETILGPYWEVIITVYILLSIAFLLFFLVKKAKLKKMDTPYEKYLYFESYPSLLLAFVFPFFFIFIHVWRKRKLKKWRNEPRVDGDGKPLKILSESDEDGYLDEGQQMEEYIKSVDYDVWINHDMTEQLTLRYENHMSPFTSCPSCDYKTFSLRHDKTLMSATYSRAGVGERLYKCSHCLHEQRQRYRIPRKVRSSNTRGGGSSSSSGGSWGGGSSGGGGAGSSW